MAYPFNGYAIFITYGGHANRSKRYAPSARDCCREEPIRTELPFIARTLILESIVAPIAHAAVSQPSPPRS